MPIALRPLTPTWATSVMGTGILANALVLLPVAVPGRHALALLLWLVAAAWCAVLLVASLREGADLRRHLADPAMAPLLGAPAIALLTLGAATALAGDQLLGSAAAIRIDLALWTAGTALGVVVAVAVPRSLRRRHGLGVRDAWGGWLVAVVPPLVSATTGAAFVAHLPAGAARTGFLLLCTVLGLVSVLAAAAVLALLGLRLARHGAVLPAHVPALWIVLGPLGQAVTAAGLLARASAHVVGPAAHDRLVHLGVVAGTPVLLIALAWLAVAATLLARARRRGLLPFSLAWWSLTFPVGTCATGAAVLATATGRALWSGVALALVALLCATWATAVAGTARGLLRAHRSGGRAPLTSAEPATGAVAH